MASLTAIIDGNRLKPAERTHAFKIANSEVVYSNGYYALNTAGYLTELVDTAGVVPLGFIVGFGAGTADAGGAVPVSVTGNTSGTPVPEAIVDIGGKVVNDVAVSGASTIAHVGELVFLGTDNWASDLTLTATTNIPAVGVITRFHTASSFEVRFFSAAEMLRKQGTLEELRLIVGVSALEGVGSATSANIAHIVARHGGIIQSTHFGVTGFHAGITSGSVAVHVNVAGSDISGGVMTVSESHVDAIGDLDVETNGTAVTNTSGNAEFADGEVIRLARKSGGLFTAIASAGDVQFDVRLEYLKLPAL